MYLVAIAWMYVVLMMAVAEALSPQGSVLGAAITLLFYGVGPLALVMYILGTPHRRRRRRAVEAAEDRAAADASAEAPDGGGQPPGDAVAPVRKEA